IPRWKRGCQVVEKFPTQVHLGIRSAAHSSQDKSILWISDHADTRLTLVLPADGIGEAYLCRLDIGSSEEHRCIRIGPIPVRENLPETGVRAVFVGFINHQNNDSELLCRDNRGSEAHRLTIKLHCRQSIKYPWHYGGLPGWESGGIVPKARLLGPS